jgi:hypothetical protein
MKSLIDHFEQQDKGTAKFVTNQKSLLVVIIKTSSNRILLTTNLQSLSTQSQLLFIQDLLYNLVAISSPKCFKVSLIAFLRNSYERITKKLT